jgi:hypothetical protein
MAVTKTIENNAVAVREQSWRINFEMPNGGAPSIQIYRESVPLDASGNAVGKPQQNMTPVTRTFKEVATEYVNIDGQNISFDNIVEALAEFGDMWAQDDAANPAPAP